jgi:hypothetical protein
MNRTPSGGKGGKKGGTRSPYGRPGSSGKGSDNNGSGTRREDSR